MLFGSLQMLLTIKGSATMAWMISPSATVQSSPLTVLDGRHREVQSQPLDTMGQSPVPQEAQDGKPHPHVPHPLMTGAVGSISPRDAAGPKFSALGPALARVMCSCGRFAVLDTAAEVEVSSKGPAGRRQQQGMEREKKKSRSESMLD